MINRHQFNATIQNALSNPDNLKFQNEAASALHELAKLLAHEHHFKKSQDIIQETVMHCWRKRNKLDTKSGEAFNYFWTLMVRQMIKFQSKEKIWTDKHLLSGTIGSSSFDTTSSNKKSTEWKYNQIADHAENAIIGVVQHVMGMVDEEPEKTTVRLKERTPVYYNNDPERIKYYLIGGKGFTKYLVEIYDYLKEHGSITTNQAAKFIPDTKKLSDLRQYLYIKLYEIAKREGDKIKLDGDTFIFKVTQDVNRQEEVS